MGVTGARDAVSDAAPELVGRVRAVSDIPVGVGLGVRSREQAAQIAGLRRRRHRRFGAGVRAWLRGVARGARTDRGTRRRCARRSVRLMTTPMPLAYFPSPPQGCVAPRAVADPGLRAVHHHRHRGRAVDRRPALGGPRRRARRHLRHRAVGGAVRVGRRPALPPGHRLADLLGSGRGRDSVRRCASGTAAWASGARSHSVVSARGSAAGVAGFRCPPSATRSRRESFWRRRSAGSATTSTRNCTAGKRRCRGGWRSSTGATRRGTSIRIRSTASRRGRSRWSCSRRSCTN